MARRSSRRRRFRPAEDLDGFVRPPSSSEAVAATRTAANSFCSSAGFHITTNQLFHVRLSDRAATPADLSKMSTLGAI
jgi:hypothetical protein